MNLFEFKTSNIGINPSKLLVFSLVSISKTSICLDSEGEEGFRSKEIDFLEEINKIEGAIISTGGGIVEASVNRDILIKEKRVIFLNSSVENQYQATKDKTKRPLLNNENPKQVLESLYEHRLDLYKSVSNLELNSDLLSNEDIVKEIINFLNV